MNRQVCIVDDEPLTRKSLSEILRREGYDVSSASSGPEALEIARAQKPLVMLTDLKMPGMDGLELLRRVKAVCQDIEVVLMTAFGSIDTAVESMKHGAFDYITKPIRDSELKLVIKRIFEQKELLCARRAQSFSAGAERSSFHSLIGQNAAMREIYNLIEIIASTNATVLVQGESGTGKRLIAQAIHASDINRKDSSFIEVSCGALPESLLESELFGHVKGAFTTAIKDRQGRFEAAHGGTIFLDEIDTFSPQLQVKLLRVLQQGEFERVGDTTTTKVDARIIAATNRDLKRLIRENLFREDLFYRLNVIVIDLPPLRERKDDIPLLVEHFIAKSAKKMNKHIAGITPSALRALCGYEWPGNIRELENVIERAVILCKEHSVDDLSLPQALRPAFAGRPDTAALSGATFLKNALKSSEREVIEQALAACGGNRKKAAELLGINRTTLYNKMKSCGVSAPKEKKARVQEL